MVHGEGPAAVLAAAGAGNTTALAHRVRRLVTDEDVPPDKILVSSFSRATVADLNRALTSLGTVQADTRTLHSFGLHVLRQADASATSFAEETDSDLDPGTRARILAQHALVDLASDRDANSDVCALSPTELADRIAAWKHSLLHPAPNRGDLPTQLRDRLREHQPENDDLLNLYRRFEKNRRARGWRTYADMLWKSWALLATDASARTGRRVPRPQPGAGRATHSLVSN